MSIHEGLRTRAAKLSAAALSLKRQSGGSRVPFSLAYLTNTAKGPDPVLVARAMPAGAAIVLRDYDHPKRASLARRLKSVCDARGVLLIIGGDERLANDLEAGLHLPSRALLNTHHKTPVLSAACHSLEELGLAIEAGAKVGFLSPVFTASSHPSARTLGIETFRNIARASPIPVLALGGVDEKNADKLAGKNVVGLGAISAFSTHQ